MAEKVLKIDQHYHQQQAEKEKYAVILLFYKKIKPLKN